jgi:hypothetical protein
MDSHVHDIYYDNLHEGKPLDALLEIVIPHYVDL